jgi:hypothetical protein
MQVRGISAATEQEGLAMDLTAGKSATAVMLALLAASTAFAQLGDEVPHATYYASMQAFYAGEYKGAERELRREATRGIHTANTRWIDSICYYAMLGEVLYHEGRNAEALEQFDQACQVLLAYPNWLLQVRFQGGENAIRVDNNRTRRIAPWGRSQRTFVIGQFPHTEQVLVGDLNANDTIQKGGVYRAPMLWRVNVSEVVRMSALAIRRRNEILGPLAAQDPITRQLSTVLAGGKLAPANHWSVAWIDLLRGLAQIGAGKLDEANMLLARSMVIAGQYDHPLTGVALLEQGHIAMLKGNPRAAATLLAEAGFSAFYFEDWDVLTESTMLGWINHLTSGAAGVYPPLENIAAWSQTNRLQHITVKTRLAQAESLMWLGDIAGGTALVDDVGRRIGEMRAGLPGIHLLYLQAVVNILQGHLEPGGETLFRALAAQAAASLRNFQILRTNVMYDSRAISARLAVDFYQSLLADPSGVDWFRNPLDAMAVMQTMQDAAFERWFMAALERKDAAIALEIAERAKRRHYLAMQPFGGRLLALRAILESPEADLSREAQNQRQQILATLTDYRNLSQTDQKIVSQLRGSPIIAANAAESKPLVALYDQWDRNANQRQHLLAQLAVRRIPSSMEFPPYRPGTELQKSLGDGEALVEFHTVGDNLFGFVVTRSNMNLWKLPDLRHMRAGLSGFLKALGNYSSTRELPVAELKGDAWHKAASEAYGAIFHDSRLDVAKTTSLVIVPDNLLWYVPFETLIPSGSKQEKTLADMFPIRYGPTAALSISNPRPLRRTQHTGISPGDLKFAGDETDRTKTLQELVSAVPGPLLLPETLPHPARLLAPLLDCLIVLNDLSVDTIGDASTFFPRARNAAKDKVNAWIALPFGGPERIILTGYKTEAELGLKAPRVPSTRASAKQKPAAAPGDEIFQSLSNMMASGARTILLTRWRTGGRTNFDLVREFAKESGDSPAAEAWQRACLLARENPIEPAHEPRLKASKDAGDVPKADHPFFWAGYLLVDTSPRPEKVPSDQPPAPPKSSEAKLPPPARPGEPADKSPPLSKTAKQPAENPPANPQADEAKPRQVTSEKVEAPK